jgi:hypothetical protein
MQIYGAVHIIIVWFWAAVQHILVQDFYAFEAIFVVPHSTIFCEFVGLSQFLGQTLDKCHRFAIAPLSQWIFGFC